MYEPVKFKRLRELATELNEKLDALQLGNLSAEELENMTEHSRELYERLVVLRYKAFDGVVKETTSAPKEEVAHEVPAPISFRIEEAKPEITPNQVSLIDAIEEVTKQEVEPEIEKSVEVAAEQVEVRDNKIPEPISIIETSNQPFTRPNYAQQESVHDRLSKGIQAKETLAEKLEHNPIPDLKKAISLNQRFQFSKELFKGNNQDYEVAIDKLNSAGREEALKHLNNLRSKYSWSNESAVTTDFVSLVERRHLH